MQGGKTRIHFHSVFVLETSCERRHPFQMRRLGRVWSYFPSVTGVARVISVPWASLSLGLREPIHLHRGINQYSSTNSRQQGH